VPLLERALELRTRRGDAPDKVDVVRRALAAASGLAPAAGDGGRP
jgi:hypothetical protein